MKKINYFAWALVLFLISHAWAQEGDVDFLLDFLQGQYLVIGQKPDSGECYQGKAVFKREGDHLLMLRSINGHKVKGLGSIAAANTDKVKVLRVNFPQGGREYEVTYLIHSDLDNYARLTGYLYLKSGATKNPGLEALFIDAQP